MISFSRLSQSHKDIVHFDEKGVHSMHEPHVVEKNAASLLAIATRGLKEGRVLHAWAIAKGLSRQEFFRKGDATILEALASMRLLPRFSYEESRRKFQTILETDDFHEPTCLRANALVGLAWASIALEDVNAATDSLEEAARIYTKQRAKELGYVIELQGLISIWNGDLESALKYFSKGKTYSQIDIMGATRMNFEFFESQFEEPTEIDEVSLGVLAANV